MLFFKRAVFVMLSLAWLSKRRAMDRPALGQSTRGGGGAHSFPAPFGFSQRFTGDGKLGSYSLQLPCSVDTAPRWSDTATGEVAWS